MDNKRFQEDQEIDLLALFMSLLRNWYLIVLSGMAVGLLAFIITKAFVTPQYVSTTRLYVLAKQGTNDTITNSELQASSLLSNDYVELVKSREVMESAIAELRLTGKNGKLISASELQKKLSVSVQNNSRVVRINATDPDPYLASDIANVVRVAASEQIRRVMDSESVNVVDEANIPTVPSSPNNVKNLLIGGVLGGLIAAVIILIQFLSNDRITTEEDVRKYLELSVLGVIPLVENESSKKSRHKNRRKLL